MPATDHRIPVPAIPAVASSKRIGNKSRPQEKWKDESVESMPETELQHLSHMRQQAVRTSEWALLSTLDAQQAIEEGIQRKEQSKQEQLQTRRALESQIQVSTSANGQMSCACKFHRGQDCHDSMQELNQRVVAERKQKDADKRMVEQAMHKFEADEQARLAARHAKHRMMKDDAARQVQMYRSGVTEVVLQVFSLQACTIHVTKADLFRHKHAQKLRIKMEDETIELQEIQRDLRLEQEKASQRKDAMRVEQHQLQLENRARIAAKEVARAQDMAEDRRLMEETLRILEAKEKQRLAEVHAFHVCICLSRQNVILGLAWATLVIHLESMRRSCAGYCLSGKASFYHKPIAGDDRQAW